MPSKRSSIQSGWGEKAPEGTESNDILKGMMMVIITIMSVTTLNATRYTYKRTHVHTHTSRAHAHACKPPNLLARTLPTCRHERECMQKHVQMRRYTCHMCNTWKQGIESHHRATSCVLQRSACIKQVWCGGIGPNCFLSTAL